MYMYMCYSPFCSGHTILLKKMLNSYFYGLTLHGDYLYWTDRKNLSIRTVHKNTGNSLTTIVENLKHVRDIQFFSRSLSQQGKIKSVSKSKCPLDGVQYISCCRLLCIIFLLKFSHGVMKVYWHVPYLYQLLV